MNQVIIRRNIILIAVFILILLLFKDYWWQILLGAGLSLGFYFVVRALRSEGGIGNPKKTK